MGKVLQQNYQNYAKTYLVQTRSQSKGKEYKTIRHMYPSSAWQGSKDMVYPEPIIRPLPKSPELIDKTQPKQNTELDPIVDFEENSPHQEGIISETYINLD